MRLYTEQDVCYMQGKEARKKKKVMTPSWNLSGKSHLLAPNDLNPIMNELLLGVPYHETQYDR